MTLRDRLLDQEDADEEPTKPAVEVPGSRFRMYVIDSRGYKVNFEILSTTTAAQLNNMTARQVQLSNWLASHEYSPDDFGASARTAPRATGSPSAPVNDNPAGETCGGETEYKAGKSAKGVPWSGYFCIKTKDEPRDRKHTPKFI